LFKTNPERTRKIIKILLDWYPKRNGVFSGAELPESKPPNWASPGSYEHLMFYTLTVAIDYQRSARDLWESARKTMDDKNTRWVFNPKKVAEKTLDELILDLSKYKLSKKKNKDANIWRTISLSLLELFDGDPRRLFEKYDYDALQIFNAMRSQYGKKFPYLAGSTGTSKILSLWLRILHREAKINFKKLNEIPIPIDIHTARATITTGCVVGDYEGSFNELVDIAKKAWAEACKDTNFFPLQLDEPLWNLSRFGCSKISIGKLCPERSRCKLSKFCTANNPESKILLKQNEMIRINTKYPE